MGLQHHINNCLQQLILLVNISQILKEDLFVHVVLVIYVFKLVLERSDLLF